MGVVYKARDLELDRLVALKVLPSERVATEDARRRFIQEARAASALNHPNIVTIHHVGSHRDQLFIAMELVPGRPLSEIIPRQGLPLGRALKLSVQIADGLATAHRAGLVHRDVKPANVMVTDEGRIKILDFGLAKLANPMSAAATDVTRAQPNRTDAGLIVGTVGYMSPEQAEGAPLDSRSDIFSFGVVLYEMATGRRPFGGETPMKTLSSILRDAPPPVSEVAPGCPRELERIIDRCLRKDPARRWQHMDDVQVALLDLKDESESGTLRKEAPSSDGIASALVAGRRRRACRARRYPLAPAGHDHP
jgi:serine/threonine protein kinase